MEVFEVDNRNRRDGLLQTSEETREREGTECPHSDGGCLVTPRGEEASPYQDSSRS